MPPIELAARQARAEAKRIHPELSDEDICVLFISPCPAKVSYIKNPVGVKESAVNGGLAINDIYFGLRAEMKNITEPDSVSETGIIGLNWAGSGGEATSLLTDKYLAADGIENCIKVLDEVENGTMHDLDFVELNACIGGCVGGTLNVENPFVAKARLRSLRKYLPISQNTLLDAQTLGKEVFYDEDIECNSALALSSDRFDAIIKMRQIEEIYKGLPHLDCGSCGAPNCHALAEDIVRSDADIDHCLIRLRERREKKRLR